MSHLDRMQTLSFFFSSKKILSVQKCTGTFALTSVHIPMARNLLVCQPTDIMQPKGLDKQEMFGDETPSTLIGDQTFYRLDTLFGAV